MKTITTIDQQNESKKYTATNSKQTELIAVAIIAASTLVVAMVIDINNS